MGLIDSLFDGVAKVPAKIVTLPLKIGEALADELFEEDE